MVIAKGGVLRLLPFQNAGAIDRGRELRTPLILEKESIE
jgi:hypothetical protein